MLHTDSIQHAIQDACHSCDGPQSPPRVCAYVCMCVCTTLVRVSVCVCPTLPYNNTRRLDSCCLVQTPQQNAFACMFTTVCSTQGYVCAFSCAFSCARACVFRVSRAWCPCVCVCVCVCVCATLTRSCTRVYNVQYRLSVSHSTEPYLTYPKTHSHASTQQH